MPGDLQDLHDRKPDGDTYWLKSNRGPDRLSVIEPLIARGLRPVQSAGPRGKKWVLRRHHDERELAKSRSPALPTQRGEREGHVQIFLRNVHAFPDDIPEHLPHDDHREAV